jgi:hypothetical protein
VKTEPDSYEVKFHFPYSSVTTDKVDKADVDLYASNMRRGTPFEVRTDYRDYIINPALVTYVEISAVTPF